MIDTNGLRLTLADVVTVLLARQAKFHLTGARASSFYGQPRFTQDIDMVIRVATSDSLDQLITELSRKFVVGRAAVEDTVRRQGIFQALYEGTMIKVDFHSGEAIKGELNRSKKEEILAGIVTPLVSNEIS